MAKDVLAVLGPHDDPALPRRIRRGAPGQVGDIRVQVTPLGCQQIDQIDILRRGLQQGGRRGDEVHVAVGRHPAPGRALERSLDREFQPTGRWVDLDRETDRCMLEPDHRFDVDQPDGEVDREGAGNVGVRRCTEDEVRARVLEEPGVDLVTMTDRRQVSAIGRGEPDSSGQACTGGTADQLDLHRDVGRRQDLDRGTAVGILGHRAVEDGSPRDLATTETHDRVGGDREVDDPSTRPRPCAASAISLIVPAAARRPPADDRVEPDARGRCRIAASDDGPEVDLERPAPLVGRDRNRALRLSGSSDPWYRVTAASRTELPGRPPASGSTMSSMGSAAGSSSMVWSHRKASPPGLGTSSVIPVWFAPYVPGMIVSVPD